MPTDEYGEEKKKFITMKSITWFIIASVVMIGYYSLINYGLMKVQGLDICTCLIQVSQPQQVTNRFKSLIF